MNKFFSFIIRQTVAILLAVVFVLAFGVYATLQMPINLLPDINVPMVCVQVIYPGANAPSVEKDVTEKLEEGLSAIGGITKVDSYSYDNLSALVLSFDYGTDTSKKQNDINGKLSQMDLPENVTVDVYDIDLNAEALAVLSVTSSAGENDDEKLANAYAASDELSARISAIDGVESVEIKGGPKKIWSVRPFKGLELLAPAIVQAFSYGALDLPLGNLTEADGEVQIRNNSDITTDEDIKNMPLEIPSKTFKAVHDKIRDGIMGFFPKREGETEEEYNNRANIDYSEAAQLFATNYFSLIKSQIQAQNVNIPDVLLKQIILKSGDQNIVLAVSDVASVAEEDSYSSYVYFGASNIPTIIKGTTIEIYKSNGANSAAVVDSVKKVYSQYLSEQASTDLGAEVRLLDDQSQFISDSISNVLISMLIGGLLAVLVIFLFLKKVRTSLIIAVTMPLSVLAAIICLFAMGITLNMVSLGGLAVGIGMLVDNSIVVIESISKHRDMDKTAFRAAVDGTTEVGGALFGSTLTTVCVFIPIIFSGGLTGEIFTDLSFAVIFSLSLSLIIAVTVIPALYALICGDRRMLKGGKLAKSLNGNPNAVLPQSGESVAETEEVGEERIPACANAQTSVQSAADIGAQPAECADGADTDAVKDGGKECAVKPKHPKLAALKEPRIMNAIISFYGKILPKVLKRKLIPILSAVIIFGASIGLLFLTGTEFLPSIDKGQIEVTMNYNAGTKLEDIQKDVSEFAGKIESEYGENIEYISVSVGKNGLLALTNTGIITVQLTTNRGTDQTVNAIRTMAEGDEAAISGRSGVGVRQIDGVVASLTSGTDDLSVTILGDDGDKLVTIAGEIMAELEKPENGFKDVKSSAADKELQTDIKFDRKKLAENSLDYQTLVLTLRIGMASYEACTATVNGKDSVVTVSFDADSVSDLNSLSEFTVGYNSSGEAIKLSDVATIEPPKSVDACIRRSDGRKMVSVSGVLPGVDTGTAGTRMREIAAKVLSGYNGYSFQQSGISSYLNDAFGGLAVALVISFFLLYAVMAVQFGSALKPLIIMASIPFSFTGGFLALVITGTSLNVVSFIGLIMLMGVVVNNAIVMLEKIKQLHESGMPHFEAVQEACKVRLRPIFMTTLTTILALIPLAIGIGQGSELMQPLGIVVIGGLLIGTLVTLIIVPTVYAAVYGLSAKYPEGKRKSKKSSNAADSNS